MLDFIIFMRWPLTGIFFEKPCDVPKIKYDKTNLQQLNRYRERI